MKTQSGIVLFLSLIFLLIISLIVIGGGHRSIMHEKISISFRESASSLEAASSAVIAAENFIESLVQLNDFNDSGKQGLFTSGMAPSNIFDENLWSSDADTYKSASSFNGITPKYFIEHVGKLNEKSKGVNILGYGQTVGEANSTLFKIVAYSPGVHDVSERVIVSYYSKYF